MAPSSTAGIAKWATGSILLLVAQLALSPVMASPLGVTNLQDKRYTKEESDRGYTLSFYHEPSCNGEAFLQIDGGQSEHGPGGSGCLTTYDPYTEGEKCASAVKYHLSPKWGGMGIMLDWYTSQCGQHLGGRLEGGYPNATDCIILDNNDCWSDFQFAY